MDDDQPVLQALARLMRALRNDIESVFVDSAKEALVRLAQSKFDVVVADIRMPEMDGAALLSELQRSYPQLVRIVLSGHADLGAALRLVPVAHQFLVKPCDAATLRGVITRAIRLNRLLKDGALQSLVAGMHDIPTRPSMYTELCHLLDEPGKMASDIALLISRDAVLGGALLKLVEFCGGRERVKSLESAVAYLGTNRLRAVIFATAASALLEPQAELHGYVRERHELHARLCAHLASSLFSDERLSHDAFAAGLLHNVGELLLLAHGSETDRRGLSYAEQSGMRLEEAERELGCVPHAHLGAYLLDAWGLTYNVVEAVAYHHEPAQVPHVEFDLVDAVYVSALVADHYVESAPNALERAAAHLAQCALAPSLAELTGIAERALRNPESGSIGPRADDTAQRRPDTRL